MKEQKIQPHGTQHLPDFADPEVSGLLKQSIRNQLALITQANVAVSERQKTLQQSFTDTMALVLSNTQTEHKVLEKQFIAMFECAMLSLAQAGLSQQLLTQQYICETGLVMSPHNCVHTIKDIYRIQGFARGLDLAIEDLLLEQQHIHILYPACGPFAPLLLPLLQYYKDTGRYDETRISVTLVDLQPGAVQALAQLVEDLSIGGYIRDIVEADACHYEPALAVDILLLEAMQHGFTREGQLSIAMHLSQYLSEGGLLVPQNVSVQGIMIHPEEEYNAQWRDTDYSHSKQVNQQIQDDRVPLGELLQLNKSTLQQMEKITLDGDSKVVKAAQIRLPTDVADMSERVFAIYARITTYGAEGVDQYDSGITHPLPDMTFYVDAKPGVDDGSAFIASSGDTVQFFYQLTGLPGFVPVKV